ncbi:peptidase C65 Otubain-domain-containing protein [Hyaloraphidium curvatum]|nr:peptidase C65 Otubain-domain-containing protein [Hyaloraphidium curvatum]
MEADGGDASLPELIPEELVANGDADQAAQPAFNRPSDQEILNYERRIKEEFDRMPAITELQGFEVLMKEYENAEEILRTKLKKLASAHKGFRSVKKDGNCFFRAFGYRLAELIWERDGSDWQRKAMENALRTKQMLVDVGYEVGAIEDFYDQFMETLQKQDNPGTLLEIFQGYASDTVVCHLRLCTAAELKRNKELYEGFSEIPIADLVAQSVEPMYVEADNLQIIAMVNALGCVNVKIANLDASATELNYHEFSPMEAPDSSKLPTIELLFRPGHYDILE